MSDFKSFNVDIVGNNIVLKRIRHNGTYATPCIYPHDTAKFCDAIGTFKDLPEDIQSDIATAIELLN